MKVAERLVCERMGGAARGGRCAARRRAGDILGLVLGTSGPTGLATWHDGCARGMASRSPFARRTPVEKTGK